MERTFAAPGPGPWELETTHFQRPLSRFAQQAFTRGFPRGFAEGTERYGLLLSHLEPRTVHGFLYQQPIAVAAPEGAMGPPPGPILFVLARVHPAIRRRVATAKKAFEQRLWREDLRRWDEEEKPRAIAKHRALLEVDPTTLDDAALAEHLRACHAHLEDMVTLHHRFTVACTVATGDYLAHAMDWTGKSAGELLGALRGSSPVSNGVAADELHRLATAIRATPDAAHVLEGSGPAGSILSALEARDDAVGEHARAYLDVVRHRSVGYDVADRSAGEMPDLLLRAIRAIVEAQGREDGAVEADRRAAALRESVPHAHRATFDELLAEARRVNRLRDERGVFADGWAVGIARRALLAAGDRLAARGLLGHREHVVDLDPEELSALLVGRSGPTPTEIQGRVRWRQTKTVADAPAFLNAPPAPPPSVDLLPPPARRAQRAINAALTNLFDVSQRESTKTVIRGITVSEGVYEGRARLVADASDFEKIEQGDVLVTRSTSPYFNVVLPLLGALVTDRGGQLSHAAIVAREYGIPGVVGTKDATRLIPDGARVRVDGKTGEVTILGT
ncbi:MAG: PEP-utilizing enzyme [Polyangiales bacterium]